MLLGLLKLGRFWSFTFRSRSPGDLQRRDRCKADKPACWRTLNNGLGARRSESFLQYLPSLFLFKAQQAGKGQRSKPGFLANSTSWRQCSTLIITKPCWSHLHCLCHSSTGGTPGCTTLWEALSWALCHQDKTPQKRDGTEQPIHKQLHWASAGGGWTAQVTRGAHYP